MIIISGFLLEASQIVSEPIFDEMVEDYLGSDDPEEVAPLKAVWARDYHVAFDPAPEITPELLEEGRTLNDESCAVCHSRPTAAFASLPLAILAEPVAATLNRIRADGLLWHLHYLVCFATLALLPFTKFKHLLTTPLTLALRTVGLRGHRSPSTSKPVVPWPWTAAPIAAPVAVSAVSHPAPRSLATGKSSPLKSCSPWL